MVAMCKKYGKMDKKKPRLWGGTERWGCDNCLWVGFLNDLSQFELGASNPTCGFGIDCGRDRLQFFNLGKNLVDRETSRGTRLIYTAFCRKKRVHLSNRALSVVRMLVSVMTWVTTVLDASFEASRVSTEKRQKCVPYRAAMCGCTPSAGLM